MALAFSASTCSFVLLSISYLICTVFLLSISIYCREVVVRKQQEKELAERTACDLL